MPKNFEFIFKIFYKRIHLKLLKTLNLLSNYFITKALL